MNNKHSRRRSGISRRSIIGTAGFAAAGSALTAGTAGFGQAQAEAADSPGVRALFRYRLGRMRVTVIDDASITRPPTAFGVGAPKGAVATALRENGLPTDAVPFGMTVTLVETGRAKVLLDSGLGDVALGGKKVGGRLAPTLAMIGVRAEEIDVVALSHGHPDHIGGVFVNDAPAFPNATYFMAPEELEYFTQKPGTEKSFANFVIGIGGKKLGPIADRIKPMADGDQIVPGVTAIAAAGHTPGHHGFVLHDGGKKLIHLVDASVHHVLSVRNPDWGYAVDQDKEVAAETRRRLFHRALDEQALVAAYHFPFPGVGRIVEENGTFRFVPAFLSA